MFHLNIIRSLLDIKILQRQLNLQWKVEKPRQLLETSGLGVLQFQSGNSIVYKFTKLNEECLLCGKVRKRRLKVRRLAKAKLDNEQY